MDALGCCIGASIKDGHAFAANADSALQNDADNAHICPYVLKHAQICADAQRFATWPSLLLSFFATCLFELNSIVCCMSCIEDVCCNLV